MLSTDDRPVDRRGTVQTVPATAPSLLVARYCQFQGDAIGTLEKAMTRWRTLRQRLDTCQASWHPNGFAVFILGMVCEDWPLRLHVWVPNSPGFQSWHPAVHSHDRDIASLVIAGMKTDIRWASGKYAGEREIYRVERTSPNFEVLRPTGRLAAFEHLSVDRHKLGEYITQPAGTLHEIPPPPKGWFATLCVKSAVVDPRLQYIVDRIGHTERTVVRKVISATDRAKILALIDGELKGLA